MNGVSNITDKIVGDAREWAKVHSEEGQARILTLQAQYAHEAEEAGREILSEAQAKCLAIDSRSKSQADMDRRKDILSAKQKAVNAAFESALQELAGLPEEERALLMVRLALKYQTKDAELIFNKADQAVVGPAVIDTVNSIRTRQQLRQVFSGSFLEQIKKLAVSHPGKLSATMSKKAGGFSGGFIIKEGDIEKNCTFEVLVSYVRDDLEGDVSSVLFQ